MAKSAGMNVKLLRKIQKHILDEPRRFNMAEIALHVDASTYHDAPPCGAICCIGGWANVLSGVARNRENDLELAAEKLGITWDGVMDGQAAKLFFSDGWPSRFYRQLYKADTRRKQVLVAVRRIDHFIKTKGAE